MSIISQYLKILINVKFILTEKQYILFEEKTHRDYLTWKRKNVTLRGITEFGSENNSGAMLGQGLYTAFLSNKAMARQYGTVYFVLNAIPKKPKVFNTLNEWEIWLYEKLKKQFVKDHPTDYGDFYTKTTIKDEMMKLGYDGIIIKGREMVNYTPPDDIKYFNNERALMDYYERL